MPVERHCLRKNRASTAATTQRAEAAVLPRWRNRLLSITRRDGRDLLDGVVSAGTPIVANRVLSTVRKVCKALEQDIISASSRVGVK